MSLFGDSELEAAVEAFCALSQTGRARDPHYREMVARRLRPALEAAVSALDTDALIDRAAQVAREEDAMCTLADWNEDAGAKRDDYYREQARPYLSALGLLPADVGDGPQRSES
jgi:hypothetical protein